MDMQKIIVMAGILLLSGHIKSMDLDLEFGQLDNLFLTINPDITDINQILNDDFNDIFESLPTDNASKPCDQFASNQNQDTSLLSSDQQNQLVGYSLAYNNINFNSIADEMSQILYQKEKPEDYMENGINKAFLCTICSQERSTKELIKKHILKEHLKRYSCICPEPGCGKGFIYKSEQRKHYDSIHKQKKPFQCKCGKAFKQRIYLERHYQAQHQGLCSQCPQCNATFSYKTGLQQHMKQYHGKAHHCSQCQMKFAYSTQLDKHYKTVHLGQRPYSCMFCDKHFANKSNRTVHIARMRNKKDHNHMQQATEQD